MVALGDQEDPPPNERYMHAFRTAETEPPPMGAPVHVMRDEVATSRPPGDAFEREERTSLLEVMADVRAYMVEAKRERAADRRLLERLGHELGHIKTHMTAQALRVANLEGIEPNGLRGKSVLVVEDDPVLLKLVARVLTGLGCHTECASNREDAERLVAKVRVDAALVDLRIPTSDDGIELCRWISRIWPATAVIVMSGLMEAPGLDSLRAARICKPFELEHLQRVLSEAMGHGPAIADTEPPPPPFASEIDTEPSPPLDAIPLAAPFPGNDFPQPSTGRETPEAKREG